MQITTEYKPTTTTKKCWKQADKPTWDTFNDKLQKTVKQTKASTPDKLTEIIITTLNKVVGKKTAGTTTTTKESKQIKEARRTKRLTRKQFNDSCRENGDKLTALNKYKEAQQKLVLLIQEEKAKSVQTTYDKILKEGGAKSNTFWDTRRKIIGANKPPEYDTINEEGTKILDPEKSKEHIANYFEQLYRAREADAENETMSQKITTEVQTWAQSPTNTKTQDPITIKELNNAIKRLKKRKSCGPDEIPNEVFIMADHNTRLIFLEILNTTLQTQSIPTKWQNGSVTRLYKGKGIRGKCSNERGITVSSNFGKLFERIVNERAKTCTNISDSQAGGKEKRSTTDHLLILKEIIREHKRRKKPIYMVFLDVTKAFDKAWLDGIMHAMYNNGLTGPLWNTVRKLNQNLTATIKTKDGPTRQIAIKDSIRQGGVLSGLQYALVMDEIAKEIQKNNNGCSIPEYQEKIGCLLWMDDVVLITDNPEELQTMINTTQQVANKYHIEFGQEKSKCMIMGTKHKPDLKIGQMHLEITNQYKYLGEIIDSKMSLEPNITQARARSEGALQTILAIAGDTLLKGIQMETIWKLVETCIIPIITYDSETWEPTKKENTTINRILDNILKRILRVPTSTPREALYIELGILDIEHTRIKKRIGMLDRLKRTENNLLHMILTNPSDKSWKAQTEQLMQKINCNDVDHTQSKAITKAKITKATEIAFQDNINNAGREKSKITHLLQGRKTWAPGIRPTYINTMNRFQSSIIFKARTRMIPVKNNFRNQYKDTQCRGCKAEIETQEHILTKCGQIHKDQTTIVQSEDYFSEDIETLKKAATNIQSILDMIEQSDVPSGLKTHKVPPGIQTHTR